MKWDGYGATIRGIEAGDVAQTLKRSLGGLLHRGKPMRRYSTVLQIDSGGRQACWIGFDQGNGLVYVEGKGETSPELVHAIRANFPDHTAPRGDVAEDYKGEGAFSQLQNVIRSAALRPSRGAAPLLGYTAFPDDPVKGRTWGNLRRGGVGYIRLYEPGKMPERAHWGIDAARVELEARPHTPKEKKALATMSPIEVWGLCGWTHRVAEALCQVEVPRFESPASVYTQAKTDLYLARAFRRHFESRIADGADWLCIGREYEEIWRLDDEASKALGQ